MNLQASDWIAIYAAVLSTILAMLKLVMFIRGYYRISVLSTTTTSRKIGNAVSIYNHCDRALQVVYWKLERQSGIWPFREIETVATREFDMSAGSRIEEYGSMTINFKDEDYFKTSGPEFDGKRYYLKLYFAGKTFAKRVRVK